MFFFSGCAGQGLWETVPQTAAMSETYNPKESKLMKNFADWQDREDFQGLLVTLSKDELQKPLKMMIGNVTKMNLAQLPIEMDHFFRTCLIVREEKGIPTPAKAI